MIFDIEQMLSDILLLAKSEKEKQDISNFYADKNNQDFIEQTYLMSSGYSGWAELSSGKTVYISQPSASAEEVGKSLKLLCERLKRG